jgi:hypothetical protein
LEFDTMKLAIAGFERALMWFLDPTTGAALGQQASLAVGNGSGAFVMDEVKNADQSFQQFTDLSIQGGDREGIAIFTWGNSRLLPFDVVTSAYDTAINDMIQGVTSIATNPYAVETAQNSNRITQQQIGFAIQQKAEDLDTGNQKYVTHFLNKCTASYRRGGGATFRGESDSILRVTPRQSNRAFTGQPFGSAANQINLGLVGGKTDCYTIITDNPIHLYSIKSNGTTTNYTLPYRPLSAVVALGATPNVFTIDGVRTALTSANVATGAIVLADAEDSGDFGELWYDTNYVAA